MDVDLTIRVVCIIGIILSIPCGIFIHKNQGFWPSTIIGGFAGGVTMSWLLYCFYAIFYVAITGLLP